MVYETAQSKGLVGSTVLAHIHISINDFSYDVSTGLALIYQAAQSMGLLGGINAVITVIVDVGTLGS